MGLRYLSRRSPHLFLLGILFHSTTNDNLRRPVTYIGPVQKLIIEFILKRERAREESSRIIRIVARTLPD